MVVPIILHLPFPLSLDVNSHVTPQMLVGRFALEICVSGVHVSVVAVVEVVLRIIFGHDVTSHFFRWFQVGFDFSFLVEIKIAHQAGDAMGTGCA
jgi:hypothetical protein